MPSQQDLQLEYDRICSFFALYKNDYNYNSSFRHKHKEAETTLSRYIWELKDKGKEAKVTW